MGETPQGKTREEEPSIWELLGTQPVPHSNRQQPCWPCSYWPFFSGPGQDSAQLECLCQQNMLFLLLWCPSRACRNRCPLSAQACGWVGLSSCFQEAESGSKSLGFLRRFDPPPHLLPFSSLLIGTPDPSIHYKCANIFGPQQSPAFLQGG